MVHNAPKMSSPKMQILRVSPAERAGREALEERGLVHVKPGTENSWKEYVERHYGLPLLEQTVRIMEELTQGRPPKEILSVSNTDASYYKFLDPKASSSAVIAAIISQCHPSGKEFSEELKQIFERRRAAMLAGVKRGKES